MIPDPGSLCVAIAEAETGLRTAVLEMRERLRHAGRPDLDALVLPVLDRIDPANPMASMDDVLYVQAVLAGGLLD